MTVDDWPILCEHKECIGTATPAVAKLVYALGMHRYYCQEHKQKLYNAGYNKHQQWVKLTPNQRPSQAQEAHSGND